MTMRRIPSALFILALIGATARGQDPPAADRSEITVTASRREQTRFQAPYALDVVGGGEQGLAGELPPSTPEALRALPSVLIQKTGPAQTSPFIRGFTGYGTLMLIDGVRLNHAAMRFGPNQYWGTVDAYGLDRIELLRGPASVLYGSDAVGGTVQAFTRAPDFKRQGTPVGGRLFQRYASADASSISRLEVEGLLGERLGVIAGGTYKDFNDVRGGRHGGVQDETGYTEGDEDARLDFLPAPHRRLTLLYQRVKQNEAPRTETTVFARPYRGTQVGNELRRVLTQRRELAYIQWHQTHGVAALRALRANLSFHRQEEERDRDRTGLKYDHSVFRSDNGGAWLQGESDTPLGLWTWGLEHYRDTVDSSREDYTAGVLKSVGIQGPVADAAVYASSAAYVQDEIEAGPWLTTLGGRYTRIDVDAEKIEDPVSKKRIALNERYESAVGNLRLMHAASRTWRPYAGVAQAFRAPSLSDLSALDDTSAAEEPAPGLEPERFLTYEGGLKLQSGRWKGETAYYYTRIEDAIVQSPTGAFSGGTPVVRKDNVGDGHVQGVELSLAFRPVSAWTLSASGSAQQGVVEQFFLSGTSVTLRDAPISRLMPASARLAVQHAPPQTPWTIGADLELVDEQEDLALRDRTDTRRIPPGGTPGYSLLGVEAAFRVHERGRIKLRVENLADRDYRVHGSGLNGPGTSAILGAEVRF